MSGFLAILIWLATFVLIGCLIGWIQGWNDARKERNATQNQPQPVRMSERDWEAAQQVARGFAVEFVKNEEEQAQKEGATWYRRKAESCRKIATHVRESATRSQGIARIRALDFVETYEKLAESHEKHAEILEAKQASENAKH